MVKMCGTVWDVCVARGRMNERERLQHMSAWMKRLRKREREGARAMEAWQLHVTTVVVLRFLTKQDAAAAPTHLFAAA